MNTKKLIKKIKKYKLIILISTLGVLLLVLTLFLSNEIATFVIGPKLTTPPQASFYFTPSSAEVKKGESFNVDIMADTKNQNVVASSVYVKYDPTKLMLQNIDSAGSVFNHDIEKKIEEGNSLIKITRGKSGDGTSNDADDGFTGTQGKIATLSMKALNATAATSLEFFNTTDQNTVSRLILDDSKGSDILSYASNATFKIVEQITPPTPSKIKLKLELQGRTKHNTSVKVEVMDEASNNIVQTYENLQSQEDGSLQIAATGLAAKVYDIRVIVPKYLPMKLRSVSLPDDATQFTLSTLLAGNFSDEDSIINELDVGVLNRKWNTNTPNIDINQDGKINETEWIFINRNWGKIGE